MILYILIAGLVLASIGFGWLLISAVDMLNIPLARWGGSLHKHLNVPESEEKDAWLFALLIGVTRIPTVVLGSLAFFFALYALFSTLPLFATLQAVSLNTFIIIFVMRVGSVFLGSALFGPNMQNIMKTLRG